MTVALAKWTLEEYHHMIASGVLDNKRVELIRGEIVEMPPEGEPHAYFSSESGYFLAQCLGNSAMVRQAKPITLPNGSEPEPDIAIVKRLGREYLDHHPYPQDIFWLIEYSDATLKKDLNIKSSVYAEVNIPEYWVVNLQNTSVTVFRHPENGSYSACTTHTSGNLHPLSFLDISISVSDLVS